MTDHTFTVTVSGCSREQAEQVMAERINVDEDYGFDYQISWATGRTVTEWGFRHPGYPHAKIGPYVETSWTGPDGWTTGEYTEENIRYYANGKPVVKRTRVVIDDVVGEWEDA